MVQKRIPTTLAWEDSRSGLAAYLAALLQPMSPHSSRAQLRSGSGKAWWWRCSRPALPRMELEAQSNNCLIKAMPFWGLAIEYEPKKWQRLPWFRLKRKISPPQKQTPGMICSSRVKASALQPQLRENLDKNTMVLHLLWVFFHLGEPLGKSCSLVPNHLLCARDRTLLCSFLKCRHVLWFLSSISSRETTEPWKSRFGLLPS